MKKIETLAEYQQLASRTCPDLGSPEANMFHMNSGIVTEIGEAIDPIKKFIAYKKPIDTVNVGEEIADCCWYIANKARIFLSEEQNNLIWGKMDMFTESMKDFESAENLKVSTIHDAANALYSLMPVSCLDKINVNTCVGVPDIVVLHKVADYFGLDFWQLLTNNIAKLQVRYPEKFTEEAALNRNLEAERKELEK